tara:strand:+ start:142 stop:1281 length:1140 start_codon:yes stop_codon:yes gene_type:complete
MDSQNNRFETLKDIFKDVKNILEKINNYGFFQRLFAWKLLKKDSTKLDSKLEDLQDIISDLRQKFNIHDDLNNVKIENDNLKKEITTYENTIDGEKKKLADAQNKYHNMITSQEKRQEKKEKEAKDKHDQEEADRKVSWQTHESEVSAFIQSECMKYDIQYIGPQDFPDRKKPDNSIIIDERYVIFDAKSPGDSQDSASFIRDLNQKAKDQEKYTKMPNVKKDIYLVVPSNLYPDIKKRHYPLGKFEAWIITMEQISVILAHYKKTMDYEKFEGLSQDDKDALIREMGNLEFNLRYKIMVDSVFGKKFLEAIKSSKDNLPEEINDEIEKVITDSKDNVSRKDSGKPLSLDSIEREFNEANLLSQSRGIPTPPIEKKSEK